MPEQTDVPVTSAAADVRDLVEASSLGTPGARKLRARTTAEQRAAVRDRAAENPLTVPVAVVSIAASSDAGRRELSDPDGRARVVGGARAGVLGNWLPTVQLIDATVDGAEYRYVVTPADAGRQHAELADALGADTDVGWDELLEYAQHLGGLLYLDTVVVEALEMVQDQELSAEAALQHIREAIAASQRADFEEDDQEDGEEGEEEPGG